MGIGLGFCCCGGGYTPTFEIKCYVLKQATDIHRWSPLVNQFGTHPTLTTSPPQTGDDVAATIAEPWDVDTFGFYNLGLSSTGAPSSANLSSGSMIHSPNGPNIPYPPGTNSIGQTSISETTFINPITGINPAYFHTDFGPIDITPVAGNASSFIANGFRVHSDPTLFGGANFVNSIADTKTTFTRQGGIDSTTYRLQSGVGGNGFGPRDEIINGVTGCSTMITLQLGTNFGPVEAQQAISATYGKAEFQFGAGTQSVVEAGFDNTWTFESGWALNGTNIDYTNPAGASQVDPDGASKTYDSLIQDAIYLVCADGPALTEINGLVQSTVASVQIPPNGPAWMFRAKAGDNTIKFLGLQNSSGTLSNYQLIKVDE